MFGSPEHLVPLIAALTVVTALLTAFAPRRTRRRILFLWFLFPAFFWFGAVSVEALGATSSAHTLDNAFKGFALLSAFLIVPWVGVFVMGVVIGILLRKLLRLN